MLPLFSINVDRKQVNFCKKKKNSRAFGARILTSYCHHPTPVAPFRYRHKETATGTPLEKEFALEGSMIFSRAQIPRTYAHGGPFLR